MINRINKFDNKQKEFEVESHMEAENNENYAIKRDTLKMQYDALTNNWRHFNTIIWGVPAVAVAIMSGILVGAYSKDINNWPRIVLLSIGSLLLFASTIEVIKKRHHMNVISLLLKDLQVELGLDEEFQFPLGISGDIDKYLDKMDKKQLFADYKHDPLFEFLDTSYARKYLTYVTFTAAISLAILAGYEFTQVLTKDTHYGKWTSVVTIVMGIVAVTGPLLHYFYKKHKVLEHGDIDFLLRSKVDQEGKSSETEQQFSIVLRREGPRDHGVILVIDDKKSLKEVGGSGVTATINDGEELRRATLSDEISGEGKYKIVKYCNHTELEYILEMPKESREAQKELGIEKKASYVILVINSKKQLLRKVTLMDCLYGRVKLTDLPKVKLIKREQKRYVNKSMGLTTMLTEKIRKVRS